MEKLLRNWFTYYDQVFQQVQDTRELISSLQNWHGGIEAMEKTIKDQIVLDMEKLHKLEKQEHQWIS